MQDAVGAQAYVSHIRGGMSHQVSDEVSSGFHFLLDFGLGLFEDSPLRQVSVYELDIVVLAIVVGLHLNDATLRCF